MTRHSSGSIEEGNYNTVLPGLILPMLPSWKMVPQKTKQIRDSSRVPDVMMETPRGLPVAVECKYDKSANIAAVI